MQVYYDRDADRDYLKKKRIAVIGYGSQGHAQANNLKDSDYDVVVGLRPQSPSWAKAEEAGLRVVPVAQAAAEGDIVMMLRSEEHTSELQSRLHLVCRLLLEKKKNLLDNSRLLPSLRDK